MRFIGLTSDPPETLASVSQFLTTTGIPWPNGYGAGATFQALGIEYLPTVLVADRGGRVVWRSGMGGTLRQAIRQALTGP